MLARFMGDARNQKSLKPRYLGIIVPDPKVTPIEGLVQMNGVCG
jgi:hypothetical protein